ncbi:ankyrin repeat domain-containing protein [Streptomyces mirabilis]|uniref:ankyrin repeat domain-containing protein n=1 Tax=Streptomyces mirabilis TaxID=68239 RepID=UPI0022526DB3|nr:ankyrin repeat domain-containing protein [Streptomyces mirabilis]MCX4427602.1 ankyrin repeat domain-containing protein [Streptomyces mirabilis]
MTDRDRLGRTAVHYAAADGDADGLRVLLAGGAAAEAVDDAGWTPLHFAAQAQAPSVVEVLLAAGAAVDTADRHGNTPLWRAVFCSQGEGATIRLLLEAGADPDRDNGHGMSPRVLAGRIANYDVTAHLPAGDATSS